MTETGSPSTPPVSLGPPDALPSVAWQAPPPEPGPAPGVEFAGYGARLVAWILDGLILALSWIVLILVFGGVFATGAGIGPPRSYGVLAAGISILFLIALVVYIAYFPFFWARGGQTPGMRVAGIRVVRDADGRPVGGGAAVLRLIGIRVSAAVFYIGFIWVFIDKRRRGWHDLIAGTVVIKDASRR